MKEQTNGERFEEFMNSIDNYPVLEGTINLCNDVIEKRTGKMTEEEWVAAERGNMTAVEWLVSKMPIAFKDLTINKQLIKQAKEMERKQILDAFEEGSSDGYDGWGSTNKEKYYNETYGSNKGV